MVHLRSKLFLVVLAATMASVLAVPVPPGSKTGDSDAGGSNGEVTSHTGRDWYDEAIHFHFAIIQGESYRAHRDLTVLTEQWQRDAMNDFEKLGVYPVDSPESAYLNRMLNNYQKQSGGSELWKNRINEYLTRLYAENGKKRVSSVESASKNHDLKRDNNPTESYTPKPYPYSKTFGF
ncbi:hypothetical protein C8R42DRAFT_316263 [Lentinula raphanica]|nr:hypothetical protein C8R42DRAFT_316263 [Lentinula raphanica]